MTTKTTPMDDKQKDNRARNNILALKLQGGWAQNEVIRIERKQGPDDENKGYWEATIK